MAEPRRKLFGEIILETTDISKEALERAVETSKATGQPLGAVLVQLGLISEKERAIALSKQWGIPFVELDNFSIDADTLKLIPYELIMRHKILPLELKDKRLKLAMAHPLDIFVIDLVRLVTGYEIEPVMATEEDIDQAIRQHLGRRPEITKTLSELFKEDLNFEAFVSGAAGGIAAVEEEEMEVAELKELSEGAPVVRLTNFIISDAIRERATDIHIQPEADKLIVRYRVDGILHNFMELPRQVYASLTSRMKVMAGMDIAERRKAQDGRFTLKVNNREYDFRVATYPGINGEKLVLRILDKGAIFKGFSQLGMVDELRDKFQELIYRPYGIILVVGPTGCGKSTTLYCVLNQLNSTEKNILTIEDPVEYQLPGITQAQVNPKAGVTFATALRSMLRQDPDIILVGEIRDTETALIAIEAALTGHLVFSTLHTNDAAGAVTRLLDMGIEPYLISSTVIGVLAQRLVRTICEDCKAPYKPPADALKRLEVSSGIEDLVVYKGAGCSRCLFTGYKGRTGVFELMIISDSIRELISKRSPSYIIGQQAIQQEGMTTLRGDAFKKLISGLTTIEEVLRVIYIE